MSRHEPIINIPSGDNADGFPVRICFARFRYEFAMIAKMRIDTMPILFARLGTIHTNAS